jgi:hypothetical protein
MYRKKLGITRIPAERREVIVRSDCMGRRLAKGFGKEIGILAGTQTMKDAFAPRVERRLMVDKDGKGGGCSAHAAGGEEGHQREDNCGGEVDPKIQNEIGRHLRAIYDDVISEPVPERFMELLKQLEKSPGKRR